MAAVVDEAPDDFLQIIRAVADGLFHAVKIVLLDRLAEVDRIQTNFSRVLHS